MFIFLKHHCLESFPIIKGLFNSLTTLTQNKIISLSLGMLPPLPVHSLKRLVSSHLKMSFYQNSHINQPAFLSMFISMLVLSLQMVLKAIVGQVVASNQPHEALNSFWPEVLANSKAF